MKAIQAAAWSLVAVLTSAAGPLSGSAVAFGAPNCEQRDVRAQRIASDGGWMARLYYNVCSDGAFITVVDHTVEITRPDEPVASMPGDGTVFAMDDRPFGVEKPLAILWTAPRELEITLPNNAWIGRQDRVFRDVVISYRYVPEDDPIERACIRRWQLLPGGSYSAFLTQCRSEGGLR